jgi:hypothetical protein
MISPQLDYTFHNMGRIGSEVSDQSQKTLQNANYLNAVLTNHFVGNVSDSYISFATSHPGIMVNGVHGGSGLHSAAVDNESSLFMKVGQERPLEKLVLQERPFLTVPYLGKGSVDTTLESQLMQGESIRGKKSVNTVMEMNFSNIAEYPLDEKKKAKANTIEDMVLNGWTRGGIATREDSEQYFSQKSKPSDLSF